MTEWIYIASGKRIQLNIWLSPAIEKYFVNRVDKQFKVLSRFYPIYIDSIQVQTKFLYKVVHSKNRRNQAKITYDGLNSGEMTSGRSLMFGEVKNPIPV